MKTKTTNEEHENLSKLRYNNKVNQKQEKKKK